MKATRTKGTEKQTCLAGIQIAKWPLSSRPKEPKQTNQKWAVEPVYSRDA